MKRLGPDLKMPKLSKADLKVPPFLVDLYWDLWDRRLLPLIALVIVAIAAVPFLLGGGSEEPSETPVTSATVAQLAAEAGSPSTLTVVQAEPGLRDYRRRLEHRSPTDPFKQRFSGPIVTVQPKEGSSPAPAPPTSPSGAPTPASAPPPSAGVSEPPPSIPPPESSESGNGGPKPEPSTGGDSTPHLTLFTFAINVHVAHVGAQSDEAASGDAKKSDSNVKHRVMPLTPVPGEKAPVVTYMGTGHKENNVLLLVSRDVTSIGGEAKCLEGGEVCQLLEVELGFPLTFVYGANASQYRIKVLKVEPVVIGQR